jgi:hypothetical protein
MKKNMHQIDRIVRISLAVVVGILYLANLISGIAAIILGVFALIFVATSFMGYCPLYHLPLMNKLAKK